jgi:hypothetical protein
VSSPGLLVELADDTESDHGDDATMATTAATTTASTTNPTAAAATARVLGALRGGLLSIIALDLRDIAATFGGSDRGAGASASADSGGSGLRALSRARWSISSLLTGGSEVMVRR